MPEMKIKRSVKFKSAAKGKLQDQHTGNNSIASFQAKDAYKDYMNEFFAGLIWLG